MARDTANIDPAWAWSPYTPHADAPWNMERATHLYRRTCFGGTPQQLTQALSDGPEVTVERLLQAAMKGRNPSAFDRLDNTVAHGGDAQELAATWLYRMLFTDSPLLENVTLFWHGHFATSNAKVNHAGLMLNQNHFLRRHALGSFATMVYGVARDPAMLVYLDSATNRKAHPNENFARELMELFCLGEGHYTEHDIQELARCFTGWEVRRDAFRFNRFQHDTNAKSLFSQTGEFNGEQAIDVVLQQTAAPEFIAKKLIHWFIMDEPEVTDALAAPVANWLVESKWELAPIVERLLTSQLFYSDHALARKIHSPISLIVGLLRSLEGTTDTKRLADALRSLGHGLYYPPNVKGWPSGRAWIDSASLLGRINLVHDVLRHESTRFAGQSLADWVRREQLDQPTLLVDGLVAQLCAVAVPSSAQQRLVEVAKRNGRDLSEQASDVLSVLATLPEFQLM